ncbi:hypothetical protein CCACVL1_00361, partial [Corchorus capsularis]
SDPPVEELKFLRWSLKELWVPS